jgi:hypothetical protein
VTRPRLLLAAAVAVLATCVPPVRAKVAHQVVVSANPADNTPHVLDGEVLSITRVGGKVIVGGMFKQVREAGTQVILDRHNLFSFDAATGAIDPAFDPSPDARVEAVDASYDGQSVFAGGFFNRAGGAATPLLAKLDVATGRAVAGFNSAFTGTSVQDLMVYGNTVFAGGAFSAVNGVNRSALAAVDATTGAVDTGINLPFTDPRKDVVKVEKLDVSPDGTRLIAGGNFTKVAGDDRYQIAMVDLSVRPARLANWQTDRFKPPCNQFFATYVRDVDIAPDGSYFVVVTNGAYNKGTLCDSASRWEMGATGTGLQPTWVDPSGGDTFTAVAVSGAAIYVGGHMRWMNNPYPNHTGPTATPGRGAVPRMGIAALDPLNGLPLSWNPGRARGGGAFALVASNEGLWVGSDTDEFGGEFHGRVALCPLAGGAAPPSYPAATLPARIGRLGLDGSMTARSFDGTTAGPPTTVATGIDWSHSRGAFMVGGLLYNGGDDGRLTARPFDGTNLGPPVDVNLYGMAPSDFPIAKVSGMFYDTGRLYYTLTGDPRLYYRYFTPESQVVGMDSFVASARSDGVDFSRVAGLTMASGRLYYANGNGSLSAMDFRAGRPVAGSAVVLSGVGQDWTSLGLFVTP